MGTRRLRFEVSLGLLLFSLAPLPAAGPPPRPREQDTAARVDAACRRALGPTAALPPAVDDETFLRRVALDLTGRLPAPEEIRRWEADAAPDKRARLVDRLLSGEAYAVNWGRYW